MVNGVTAVTDYIGGIQYKNNGTTIDFIQTEEGKAVPYGTNNFDYTYYLADNLGNTRLVFDTKFGKDSLQQRDDYYPFGLEINRTISSPKNEYLYNRKELQEEFSEYDYGARYYDPVVGRWTSVDPLAEKSRRFSPYVYVENNPIRMIDPDGMETSDGNDDGNGNGVLWNPWVRVLGFFIKHQSEAWAIGKGEKGSTDISAVATNFAVNSGLQEDKSAEGTERNAMRHTTWQAIIASHFGKQIATEAGDAHEEDPNPDLTQRTFNGTNSLGQTALDQADQSTDLLNNMIGRQIGSDNKNLTQKQLAVKVLDEFHNNGLYTKTVNKDGSITIGKSKLTDKEYKAALKNIRSLNDDGRTKAEQDKYKKKKGN